MAFDLDSIDVTHDGDRYGVDMRVRLDVSPKAAYAVFADVKRLPEINAAVKEVTPLPDSPPGLQRVYTRVRVCAGWFCQYLEQVQDMRFSPTGIAGGKIHADVIPGRSNLKFGVADWAMEDCAGRTCLHFVAQLEPKFWMPPLIGPWIMQRKLREEAMETSTGIERLAAEEAVEAAAAAAVPAGVATP